MTQNQKIIEYMKKNRGITSLEATMKFHITRLSGRIYELKRMGYQIGEKWEKTETARFKRYFLTEETA